MESKKKMSVGMGFAAGALFGAIAVFVPFVSAGHPRPAAQRLDRRAPSALERPASGKARPARSEKRETGKPSDPSNDASCDVQLD